MTGARVPSRCDLGRAVPTLPCYGPQGHGAVPVVTAPTGDPARVIRLAHAHNGSREKCVIAEKGAGLCGS